MRCRSVREHRRVAQVRQAHGLAARLQVTGLEQSNHEGQNADYDQRRGQYSAGELRNIACLDEMPDDGGSKAESQEHEDCGEDSVESHGAFVCDQTTNQSKNTEAIVEGTQLGF